MENKTIGIGLIILEILMLLYNRFNFITTEKVVDISPINTNKEVKHPIA